MQISHFEEFLKSNQIFPKDYNLIYLKLKSLSFYRDVGSFGSIISKSRFEVNRIATIRTLLIIII